MTIRNPFAEKLHIPKEVFKPRRTNAHYLAFIEAVTFYHQYQRESEVGTQTGEEFISTTIEDIEEANKLMKEVLLRKSDDLNGATRKYFESLKDYLNEEKKEAFGNREIRHKLRIKGTTLRRYHHHLLDAGLIRVKSGKKSTGYTFEVVDQKEYEELKNTIEKVLDQMLEKCASAPRVRHSKNGSVKHKKAS